MNTIQFENVEWQLKITTFQLFCIRCIRSIFKWESPIFHGSTNNDHYTFIIQPLPLSYQLT